ncbi:DNA polymerase III, subunit gamma and tau [Syntrophotalea acetylenivorans]|uniref:DNA polymerase III subunit gamma/tau n=1 Tax=Syntrophotalea acetylenivorans TaxID=1842532 RepID=A0A1L3GPM6_9BACT|nr:DNA polymerase III subunit gamma/tau [Syntrophotalea acetylenivorans]APG27882.1 DNA polymerase III, subunit gamma and tau [Syntrophotalea acetylenivorans]
MSYLVLARKYRPQSFEDLVGQEHVSRTLVNAINSGRVHHAFLFTGARGVGKTSAARIFAKALNCEQGLSPQPCQKCPSCVEITAGQGQDVFEIDGASNTGVDDIRELRENIRYLPAHSRFKLFIIDEVHMLSINAFNALLKTLEEPPDHAKFIFATTEPHKIPITILSRCQRFDFRKISLPAVTTRLREIADSEKIEISDRSLALVARRGEGSMRDSLSTLDQVLAFCGNQVADEEIQGLLGMVDRRLLLDTVEGVVEHDSRRVLDSVRRVDDLGHSFRQFCQELVECFRALVLIKVVEEPGDLLDTTVDELAQLQQLADQGSVEDLQRVLTLLVKTEAELAGSTFPRLALEMTLVRLTHLPPGKDIGALLRKVEDLERRLAGNGPVVAPVAVPASAASPQSFHGEELPPAKVMPVAEPTAVEPAAVSGPPRASSAAAQGGWPELVAHIRKQRPRIGSILEHGRPVCFALPDLEVGFVSGSFHLEQMKDSETATVFQKLAEGFFQQSLNVRIVAVDDGHGGRVPPSLAEERRSQETGRREKLEKEARDHPVVQAAQEILGGEIIEIKPIDKENPQE